MKLKMAFALLFLGAVLVYQKSDSETCFEASDLLMENIEALAVNELFGDGNKKVLSAVTEMSENGVIYKCRAVVECEDGGTKACQTGVYLRERKDNGDWSSWQKIG